MTIEARQKTRPEIVTLPQKDDMVRQISQRAFQKAKPDKDRDTIVGRFAELAGGQSLNAQGLSMMWDGAVTESFPRTKSSSVIGSYFTSVLKALSVPEQIASKAQEFRKEMLYDHALLSLRDSRVELRAEAAPG
jgi:hypothetical protein